MTTRKSIGKYEIVDALGTGGMGTVYRAFDPTLERIIALKLLNLEALEVSREEIAERFRNEARAVARLNHPAIVAIFDYDDQDPAGAYIAMEYVNGCALDEYVKQRAEPHLQDAISAMQQVLAGLDYAHRRDVVHRDIKPSNLLVTRTGMVKITDFGIAKIGSRNKTHTGLLAGTPQYMAPEQYTGGKIDHRCDIYASGVVLYELMTGVAPFVGSAAEVMHKVCYGAPAPPSTVNAQIPLAFDAVITKALNKNPDDRYATAAEFRDALCATWQSVSSEPASATLSQKAQQIATTIRRVAGTGRPASGSPARETSATPVTRPNPATRKLTRPDSSRGQNTLAAWSSEQLAEIERQLTQIVGPLAKVLVRSAASNTANRQQLYEMLATHLRTPEERRRFLAGEAACGTTGKNKAAGAAPVAMPSGLIRGRPLTPEMLQRATQLLSKHIGPIASVVTKKAAQTAVDEPHLYSLLAGKLTDPAEQEQFMREAERSH